MNPYLGERLRPWKLIIRVTMALPETGRCVP